MRNGNGEVANEEWGLGSWMFRVGMIFNNLCQWGNGMENEIITIVLSG
jgi:hypothetical protein